MAGSPTYTDEQIIWVLDRVLAKARPVDIQVGFESRFERRLTGPQLRYLKTKYGRDPRFKYVRLTSPSSRSRFLYYLSRELLTT